MEKYRSYSIVKPRDYLQRRTIAYGYPEDDSLIVCYQSVEHEDCPKKKNFVRAETILSGFIIRDLGNGASQFTIISQTDVKGTIPKTLVNMIAASLAPKQIEKFMGFAKKRKEEDVELDLEQFRVIQESE